MPDDRFDLLSETQREYLRSVQQGLTSKQIAQRYGGSHHTVDAEIAIAVRLISAKRRPEAAAMLAAYEARASYEHSYETPRVVDSAEAEVIPPTGERQPKGYLPLPIATAGRPTNTLTFGQRTMWIAILAVTVALVVGGLFSGIAAQLNALGSHT